MTVHADYDDDIFPSEAKWSWLRDRIDRPEPLILACSVPWLQFKCADIMLLQIHRR